MAIRLTGKIAESQYILLPFNNPSSNARVVVFSDSEVGTNVENAFNRFNLIGEKSELFEKSFAEGKVPDVDITIVVFPPDSSESLTTKAMTQAEYDALPSKDNKTMYVIVDRKDD